MIERLLSDAFLKFCFRLAQPVFHQRQAGFEHVCDLAQFQPLIIVENNDFTLLWRKLGQRPL